MCIFLNFIGKILETFYFVIAKFRPGHRHFLLFYSVVPETLQSFHSHFNRNYSEGYSTSILTLRSLVTGLGRIFELSMDNKNHWPIHIMLQLFAFMNSVGH